MGVDEDLIADARRAAQQIREAALVLDAFASRLDQLTAELRCDTRDGGGDGSAQAE
jgi:hypothetical protein